MPPALAPQRPGAAAFQVPFAQRGAHLLQQHSDRPSVGESVIRDRSPDGASTDGAARIRQDLQLLQEYQDTGDPAARDAVIERFLPLARQLARRYERPDEPIDDLVQVASMGLVKAVERFDPSRGIAFSSFAVPTILGELKRYFRDAGWAVHVPRSMQERVLEVNRGVTELSRKLGRSPTPAELARATEFTHEEVLEALEAATAYDSVPLDAPRSDDDNEAGGVAQLGAEDPGYELAEYSATLAPELRALPQRDRLVLYLRFVEDLTQSEIAERIGVSQMHVSRLIRAALLKLRAGVGA